MKELGKVLEFPGGEKEIKNEEKEGRSEAVEVVTFFDPDKPPRILASCRLVDGEIRFEGDKDFIRKLLEEDFSINGKSVSPKDGKEFLEALKVKYRNPYLLGRDKK